MQLSWHGYCVWVWLYVSVEISQLLQETVDQQSNWELLKLMALQVFFHTKQTNRQNIEKLLNCKGNCK